MPRRGTPSRLSDSELAAWQGLIRLEVRMGRIIETDLRRQHQLTRSAYDVMLQLALAPGRTLRMSELAGEVLMSHNGISRVVAQLEQAGLVVRERDPDDGRVVRATLTRDGRAAVRNAGRTHLARIREEFLDHLSDRQLDQLRAIWDAIDPALVAGSRDGGGGRPVEPAV